MVFLVIPQLNCLCVAEMDLKKYIVLVSRLNCE